MMMVFFLCAGFVLGALFYNIQTLPTTTALAQVAGQGPSNLLNYQNPTYGIKMQYPTDWTASTSGIPSYNGIIGFYSPLQGLSDTLPAELTLSITTYSQAISLDEYTKATLGALEKQGIKVDESSQNTLSGKPGYKITFSPPNPATQTTPVSLKVMQTWTTIDNKVYVLSFNADSTKFATYLPTVQKMLNSFQIQPPSV
jgi:serine/threonine-protein kinase